MCVSLVKAYIKDAEMIYEMQIKSFKPLLDKYQDFETNPANETLDQVINRLRHPSVDYYFIKNIETYVGVVRVVKKENQAYRLGIIYILPEYQGLGIAQKAMNLVEGFYPDAVSFELDTILQEDKLCYLYEKLGYQKTGLIKIINEKMTIVYYQKKT